jgi:hypothetical protein
MINRRQWLRGMGIITSGAAQLGRTFAASRKETQKTASPSLSLAEFSPKSMLQVPETHVARHIYGVNLPETILRKVYFENAAHQLNVV